MLKKSIAICMFFFLMLSFSYGAKMEKCILFVLTIDKNGSAKLENYFAVEDFATKDENGAYTFELLDSGKSVMYKITKDVVFTSVEIPYGWSFEESQELLEETSSYEVVYITMPLITNASYFRVSKGDSILLEEKISVCNHNGICENHENSLSCGDCSINDALCVPDRDGVCDPDCIVGLDPDCGKKSVPAEQKEQAYGQEFLFIWFAVGAAVLIAGFLYLNRKKLAAA